MAPDFLTSDDDLTMPGGVAFGDFSPRGENMPGDGFAAREDVMARDGAAPRSDFGPLSQDDLTTSGRVGRVRGFSGVRHIGTLADDDATELLNGVVRSGDGAFGADSARELRAGLGDAMFGADATEGDDAADRAALTPRDTPDGDDKSPDEPSKRRITVAGRSFSARTVTIAAGAAAAIVVVSTVFVLSGRHSADAPSPVSSTQPTVDQMNAVPGASMPGVALPYTPPLPAYPAPSDPRLHNPPPAAVRDPDAFPDGPVPANQLPGGPPMPYSGPSPDPGESIPPPNDPQLGGPQPDPSMDGMSPDGQLPPPPADRAGQPGTGTQQRRRPESLTKRLGSLGDPSDDSDGNNPDNSDPDGTHRKGLGGALGGLGGGSGL